LLNAISTLFSKYIVFPSAQSADVLALWVAHTFLFDCWDVTPYLGITSPEPGSGKTNLLTILECMCRDAYKTGSTTPAGMYQRIEADKPTFLVDEFDTAITARGKAKGQLQNIFNQGYKVGGCVTLAGGRRYDVFCPKALAGIGELPVTIATRSIPIRLVKRLATEPTAPFYNRDVRTDAAPLREQLAGIQAHADHFREADHPPMPAGLSDRENELWEPLIAIAEFAGGIWPDRVRVAISTHRRPAEEDSPGTLLLRDLAEILTSTARRTQRRWSMKELVNAQRALEAPNFQGALDTRELGRMLRTYGIQAKPFNFDGRTARGYEREQFRDAIARYVR
jgi:hypothetical protein